MDLFFPATRQAINQVTSLFNFVWPTAAALWNLRWQVKGFITEVPQASVEQLKQRFLFGSKIDNVDLKRTVQDHSWEDQTAIFASFVLTNAFAIYEQWADEILQSLGQGPGHGKRLQFPDRPNQPGITATINNLCQDESAVLMSAYYPIFSSNRKYSLAQLGSLIACYRYFKEIRNAQVHSGGIANQAAVAAYQAFQPVSGKGDLGRKGELVFDPVVLGQPVALHLRGVVGFTDVLIKIMVTVDAELCRSEKAEAIFEKEHRLANAKGTLSANPKRRNEQAGKRCIAAGYPRPRNAEAIYNFLRAKKLITI